MEMNQPDISANNTETPAAIIEYMRKIGSKGGHANTPKQMKARLKNARKGGRPKGSKNKAKKEIL